MKNDFLRIDLNENKRFFANSTDLNENKLKRSISCIGTWQLQGLAYSSKTLRTLHDMGSVKMQLAAYVTLILTFYNADAFNDLMKDHCRKNSTSQAPIPSLCFSCITRYDIAYLFKNDVSCENHTTMYPICSKDISVSYSNFPPYVFKGENKVEGVLPGMWSTAIVHIKIFVKHI